jgi:hypothetical protein
MVRMESGGMPGIIEGQIAWGKTFLYASAHFHNWKSPLSLFPLLSFLPPVSFNFFPEGRPFTIFHNLILTSSHSPPILESKSKQEVFV